MENRNLGDLTDQPREQYKGFTLVGFVGKDREELIQNLEYRMKRLEEVTTFECYLDHRMLVSGMPITPQPLMAYSVQNGVETIEEANKARNEAFSEANFTRIYDWGNFDPSAEGMATLDEALREYDSEINNIMQRKNPGWKRKGMDSSLPWPAARAIDLEEDSREGYMNCYGLTRGLEFLDFTLQVIPYDLKSGLTDHPTVRKIFVNNPCRSGSGVEPLGVITDREVLDKIPFIGTIESERHIFEPTQEGFIIYHEKLKNKI